MAVYNTLMVPILVLVSTPLSQLLPITSKTQDVTIRKEPDVSTLELYNRFTALKFIVEGDLTHFTINCIYGGHLCSEVSHTSGNSTHMEIAFFFDKHKNVKNNAVAKLELRIPGGEVVARSNFTTMIPAKDMSQSVECDINTNVTLSCLLPLTFSGGYWVMGGRRLTPGIAKKHNITITQSEKESRLTTPCTYQINGTSIKYIVGKTTICKNHLKLVDHGILNTSFETSISSEPTPTGLSTITNFPSALPSSTTVPTVSTTVPTVSSTASISAGVAIPTSQSLQAISDILLVPLSIALMAILVVFLYLVLLRRKKTYCSACQKKIDFKARKTPPMVDKSMSEQCLVVTGIEEQPQGTAERTRKINDLAAVKEILSSLNIEETSIYDTRRLGVYTHPRPVLASFSKEEDVDTILHNGRAAKHFSPYRSPEDQVKLKILQQHRKCLIKSGVEPRRIRMDHPFLLIDNQYHGYVDSDNIYQTLPQT